MQDIIERLIAIRAELFAIHNQLEDSSEGNIDYISPLYTVEQEIDSALGMILRRIHASGGLTFSEPSDREIPAQS